LNPKFANRPRGNCDANFGFAARGRFIAIIDKDRGVRRAIIRLLRVHGLRAQGFASAEAFLWRGRTDEPACLVMDVELDRMSGVELLHRLKTDGSQIPVVVMTAAEDEKTRRSVLAAGCVAYLQKPSSAELLLAAIGKATDSLAGRRRDDGEMSV
jgi:FixJ family two-component response regulator